MLASSAKLAVISYVHIQNISCKTGNVVSSGTIALPWNSPRHLETTKTRKKLFGLETRCHDPPV